MGPILSSRAPLVIGSHRFELPVVQAALSGYSDLAMRRVARAHGAPYAIHEVVLNQDVLRPGKLQRQILDLPGDDHPVGGQLMGAVPDEFGRAARLLIAAGFDVIDINFGCPVPKVLGRCRGGFLLSQPDLALEVVDSVLDSCAGAVPVTIKLRRGLDDSLESERAFFRIVEGALERGVTGLTVHPRTVAQRYEGPSRWPFLARVRRMVGDVTLLGSGDLFSPFDVADMIGETGVDGVTVARGCIGNPWIFGQCRDLFAGREPVPPTIGEQRAALELHWRMSLEQHGPERGASRARTHAIQYAAVHPDRVAVRDALITLRDEASFRQVLATWYPPERAAEVSAPLVAERLSAQRLRAGRSPQD